MQQSIHPRWILLLTVVVASGFIILMIIKVSNVLSESSFTPKLEDKTRVTILTTDEIIDQSWGSLAYVGQLKIEEQFPVEVTLYSEINTEPLQEETLEKVLETGVEVVIGHGREFSEIFTRYAPLYSNVHFVTIHGDAVHENQSVYSFNQGEIERKAGIAAALISETSKIGLIDAVDAREEQPQFEEALYQVNPDISLFYKVVNSWDDNSKAVEYMEELVNEGVDVVYSRGNGFNRAVIEYGRKHQIYMIGYLEDQSYMASEWMLTSVMNDVSQMYVAIMKDYFSEEGILPGVKLLTEEDGVYQLAPFGPMFTEEDLRFIYE
ncbi:BMP family ABC transporter substrate-binding protein [Halalkalibacter akibai]|uniref:Positive regulator of comK n=1 Tax=Halalkalibacter akibai (strain ATCC 43226 / DSM 21942 / CIP 109018 / JCM 9157 / 1139) TaxID=1236973 RepID=W4R0L8_HALA3|nr:BMP family ABC transporter substrate-binding protein [Halalkalibacter akibai]GAE37433.1 positive regulator of comK [Halalkalibacter akibai JCM 9157]